MARPGGAPENMIPWNSETARIAQAKGAEAKRRKRNMHESAKNILSLALHSGSYLNPDEVQALAEMKGQNISVSDAIVIAQVQKAIKGDTQSANFLMSLAGDKPADKLEVGMSIEDYVKSHKPKL